MEKLKALHVVGRMDIGGAESRIMDIYRHIDRDRLQFYFMQHTPDRCAFADETEELGGRIFTVPRFHFSNYFAYVKAWKLFFDRHPEIRIVHGHITSTAGIYLPIARKAGRKTIAHARSAGVDPGIKGFLTRQLRRGLAQKAEVCFACSALAGDAVFGKKAMGQGKVEFFPNAVDTGRFSFSERHRREVREELGLRNNIVLGHVGRFAPMKNHGFLLRIMKALEEAKQKGSRESSLLLLGDGPGREAVMEQAAAMGISHRVIFLGIRKDVWRYYSACDVFLLPSLYEGLPGTAIEAQANGLRGILADTVTPEAVITGLMRRKSLNDGAKAWAEEIIDLSGREVSDRKAYAGKVKEAGFDVKEQAAVLEGFYRRLAGE